MMTTSSEDGPFTFSLDVDQAREDYITDKLVEFNKPYASPLWQHPPQPRAPLHVYIINEPGVVIGGLIGRTNAIPEWLEVSVIWVEEALRGRGLGRQLMLLAESEAKKRGCHFAKLATSQFQAPGFYQKLGYRLYGTLEDFPRGEIDYYFTKKLDDCS